MMQRHLFQGMQSWQRANADFMLNLIPKTFSKMHYKKCHNKRGTSNLRHKMHWSEGIRLQIATIDFGCLIQNKSL